VRGILADNDVRGQVEYLVALMQAEPWQEFWQDLRLAVFRLEDFTLLPTTTDRTVWERCQAEAVILITGNRTMSGSDSLEATIRERNSADSLPVFTIADAQRVATSKAYAEELVESLLDYLQRIETLRGTGRLYLP
jgi:hypothetical protein